jgi:hypothetical protein
MECRKIGTDMIKNETRIINYLTSKTRSKSKAKLSEKNDNYIPQIYWYGKCSPYEKQKGEPVLCLIET